jgi:hypothetical protein
MNATMHFLMSGSDAFGSCREHAELAEPLVRGTSVSRCTLCTVAATGSPGQAQSRIPTHKFHRQANEMPVRKAVPAVGLGGGEDSTFVRSVS